MLSEVKTLAFQQRGDERGHLVIVEGEQTVPFPINRIFYIYGSDPTAVRGQHANRRTDFALINVAGQSKVRILDGRGNEEVVCLSQPHTGVYIPKMIWKEMYDFSPDSVLLCLASEHYDPDEYIRDYGEYVKEVAEADALQKER